ncbi:SDR family oxidoreductase [Caldiplasma sukawensis]
MGIFEEYFNGKTVVVAGVGSGQGLSSIKLLEKMGARVIAISRTGNFSGENVHNFNGDMSDERQVSAIFSEIKSKYGFIDGIINNSGKWEPADEKFSTTEKLMDFVKSNILPQYNVIYHSRNIVKEGGSIVNVSASVRLHSGNHSAYNITKDAILQLTKDASISLKERKVRVNAIAPGPVSKETKFDLEFPFNFVRSGAESPLAIAYVSLFLLSPLSISINGQCVTTDSILE